MNLINAGGNPVSVGCGLRLTWYYNVYDDGFAVGTGALTYTGSGDGRFTITSATYTEKSPNPDTNYALSTDTTIPNFFALDQVLQLNQVIVQNGYISAYNLEFIDPTQPGSNYARIFYNDGSDTPSVYDVTENPSNGTLIGDRPLQFLQGGSVVPWDVPNAPMTVVFSTILALSVMRTGKKFQKAKVGR